MTQGRLSYSQAPPFSAPLRFFLTAPLFLVAAGILALHDADAWTAAPAAFAGLAMTHLVTLGFLAMVMLGALMQVLPVILGAPFPAVMPLARAFHAGLTAGTVILVSGFVIPSPAMLEIGAFVLGATFLAFIVAMGIALRRSGKLTRTPFTVAGLGLAITILLGSTLVAALNGTATPIDVNRGLQLHVTWAFIAWIFGLVVATSYQVVPMLQVTPAYPLWLRRWLAPVSLIALAAYSVTILAGQEAWPTSAFFAAPFLAAAAGYALVTLDLFRRRRRKIGDSTLRLWKTAMVSLLAWVILTVFSAWQGGPDTRLDLLMGVLFLLGFAISVVCGMLYKIVPFLAWFHLQAQGHRDAPSMRELLPEKRAKRQLLLHWASLACFIAAPFAPTAVTLAGGLLLAASAGLLWLNLWRIYRRFRVLGGH